MDLVLGKASDPSDDSPHMVRNLCGGMDDQSSVLHPCKADVGLKRSVLDLACLVCGLYNGIRMCERLVHVSDLTLVGCGDVLVDVRMERELVDDLALPGISGKLVVLIQVCRGSGPVLHNSVVDKRGSGCHGLLDREDGGKNLVLDLDLGASLFGGLEGLGDDCGDTVSDMADLHVEQSPVVRGRLGVALTGLHVMGLRSVVGCEDLHDALDLPGFRIIDALDVCTCVRASEDDHVTGVGCHVILDERPLTGYELRSVDLGTGLSDDIELGSE